MATNFSKGLSVYGIPVLPDLGNKATGNVFFVDSGIGVDAAGVNGKKIDEPFATIDYAINQCTANNGDIIYVLPGHAETLNSSGALIPDVAGVSIVGLGWGADRPTISMSTSGSNESRVGITGASVRISNIIFRANSTSIGSSSVGIRIGADDVILDNCRFDHNSTLSYFETTIEIPSGSDRVRVENCDFVNKGTTGQADRAIDISGTGGHVAEMIIGNRFFGNWSGPGVIMGSTDGVYDRFMILNNFIHNCSTIATDRCIYLPSSQNINGGSAGIVSGNFTTSGSSGTLTGLLTVTYFRGAGNYNINSTGITINANSIAAS